ncbi:MAG: type I restriction-modification system subunit M [Paludibacteraceae bacterium]|nr:type I restriction-modification system subunit M [Paludibacteraceae bacterium]
MEIAQSQIVSFIWGIADDCLRDVFVRGQYRDVILPMVVLRRFDALLEPTKEAVENELKEQKEMGFDETTLDAQALQDITHLDFYNTSKWTLNRLKSQATDDNNILLSNFEEYLNGYSKNVKDVLKNFDFDNKAKKLATNDRLLAIIEKITDPHINLTDRDVKDPDGIILPAISNIAMGTIFEELLRRFNEENNEEAGEHFTPRDAIELLARLVFEPVRDELPPIISIYDPAEGSGGMLTEGRKYLMDLGIDSKAIQLFGTEINPETYAICKSDLIIKGVNPEGMHLGNTITENHFSDKSFGYMLTNPPYGKSWKSDKEKIYHDKSLLDQRFELQLQNFQGNYEVLDCTPRTSDGQLLFILEEIDKMKPLEYQPQGSRAASIHNGSSLFTGDAGSGESNIRRYLLENDFVDAIIQLPNNIFYNTGITTYIWLMTNKKETNRKGKIQLIDASGAYEKLRKNQGSRNCTIPKHYADLILDIYNRFTECDATDEIPVSSKIFDCDDFRYYAVTIERPLRLRCQFTALKIDNLLYDSNDLELSKLLYDIYAEQLFTGVGEAIEFKEYLQEQEITLTDKKFNQLTSAAKWKERKEFQDAAFQIMQAMGTDVFTDYNNFIFKIEKTVKEQKLKLSATQIKTLARAMSVTDPDAKPVIKKRLKFTSSECERLTNTYGVNESLFADYGIITDDNEYVIYEPDTELRDTEKIPVKENIYEYFQREVHPYVDDAWIAIEGTKIGCEISFNKYFYKPVPLRSLEENEADILALDAESQGFIKSLFE